MLGESTSEIDDESDSKSGFHEVDENNSAKRRAMSSQSGQSYTDANNFFFKVDEVEDDPIYINDSFNARKAKMRLREA